METVIAMYQEIIVSTDIAPNVTQVTTVVAPPKSLFAIRIQGNVEGALPIMSVILWEYNV